MANPTYATQTDLLRHIDSETLVELTDDDKDGLSDAGVIGAELEAQSRAIDGAMINAGYGAPLSTWGSDAASLACRLALGVFYARRPQVALAEAVRLQIEAAQQQLRDLAQGKTSLTGSTRDTIDTTNPGGIAVSSDDDRGWSDAELF